MDALPSGLPAGTERRVRRHHWGKHSAQYLTITLLMTRNPWFLPLSFLLPQSVSLDTDVFLVSRGTCGQGSIIFYAPFIPSYFNLSPPPHFDISIHSSPVYALLFPTKFCMLYLSKSTRKATTIINSPAVA